MQFGSSNTAVFFKMRVAGVLHIFQFETKQVEFDAHYVCENIDYCGAKVLDLLLHEALLAGQSF